QERLWFLDQLEPNDPIYNIPASVKLIGDLSVDALQQAIEDIIQRHETLRSQIIVVDGKPKQLIHASGVTQLVKIDLSNITEKEQSVQVNQLAMDESRKAFDLSLRELFRTTLISLNDKEYVLLLTLHHIISDGWSNALLIRELSAFYLARLNNNHAQLPNLPIQYADYAHWQRQWLQGEVIDALIGYWYNHLQGAPAFITLPTDRPRPAIQTFNGDHYNFRIAKDLSDELVSLSQQQGVTLFMMLMAVYQLLLSRYAGQDDISVGIPIAGRNRTEVEGLIGFFINGLILRTDLSGNPSFSDLLKRVREVTLDAYAHQDAPAEMVVEALSPERNLSYSPLAQVGFALQNIGLSGQLEIPGLRFEPIEQENKTSKYDMTLIMAESADGLMGSVEYNTDLFDESTIETMMRHFQHLLKTVVLQSESSLSTLAVFDRHELFQILNIGETEYEKILPLTSTQRDIYLESVLNPDTQFNSIGYAIEVNHKLDVDCWTKALQKITDHEPLLRTKIIASDLPYTDLAYQCVLKHKKISVKIIEMEGNTVDRGYLEDIVFRSYDMTKDDLVQYFLLKYSDDLWVLIMTCHHTMMDGLGGWEHWDRMHLLYAAELNKTEHELAEPAFEQFIGDSLKLTDNVDVINYWKQKSQNIEPLDFSVSSAWKGDINQQIITKQLTLPNEQWKKIRSFCRKNKSTPAVYFKALYGLLINGYCQPAANFQISEYLGNRRKQHNTALGCYYEQVPAVFDLSAMSNETSIKDYLASVRGFVKEVKGLQHLSILKQKQYLGQGRIQFAYNFITIASEYQFLGEDVQKIHHFTPPVAEGQVQFITKLVNDELQFFVHYYPETFTDFDFLQRFVTLNEQMLAESCEYLGELQLLSDNEKSHQVMTLNQNAVKQADVVAIQCLIEQQVEKTPDAIALQFQQEKLTYQQLNQRSNQLAHYLRNNEVGVGSKVGICLERSSELLVAVIAVLKSGAAYVPMDSSYPQGRLEYMVEDSTIPLLITHSSLEDKFDNADIKVVCIDKDQAEIEHCSTDNPEITNKPDDMAYVIYTSGTTGRPKGATVRHSGEINLLQWYTSEFNFAEVDKTLLISAFGFDLTQKNLFALLTVGGCVVIPDMSHYDADIIASNIEEHSITLLNCAPSAFYPMVDLANNDKANINSLHHVFLGGEPIQVNQLNQWLSSEACQCQIVNTYGPTECTDIAAFYRLTDPTEYLSKSMPIGQANSNVNLYIVNQQHQLIPEGLVGELCIGGVGVGLGYLNQTELTDEKFITNPFGDSKIYKTGDLVRYLPDGNIEYIGRIDHQVKLRGLRIELTEIECVLNQQSAVKECLVLVKNDVLVAYILTNKELDNHHLKSVLGHELPEYMIPQSLVTMDTWPLTPNGKIDRKALPEPNTSGQANYVAPTTEIEMILAQQWSQLLVLPKVGVQHNFFDLGGHSLLATQAISQIRDHFEIELPLRVLFEAPTIAELAAKIEITLRQGTGTPVPAIKSIDRTQDLPLSFAQERLWFIDQFQPNSIAYNIPGAVRIKGYINVSAMQSSLNDLIERHESLRTIFINQEGSAFQRVQAFKPIQIKQIQQPDNVDIAKDLIQRAKAEASLPFDLSVGPLLRVQLVQIDTEDHALFITMHHIVSDGWSMTLFIKEMAMLYDAYCKGHQPQLAPLPIQYGDYAFWQREWLQGDVLDQQLSYWKQELCEVGNLNLPTDRPRPAQQTMAGSTIEFNVDEKLARELRQFSQQNSSTLFMTLISVYQILLMRYSQQTDFAIGTPIAGRNRGETEQLIGLFVNTLAMKSQCHDDPDFKTLLERVREHSLDAYAHQDLPFERIVDALKLPRNVSQSPVFQVMFTLQTDQNNTQQGGTQDIQLQAIEMESHVSKFDISLTLTDHDNDKLSAVFEYNIDLFDKTTIETMIVHFNNLLSAVLENPETSINELPMLTKNECQQLLVDWNQTQQDFDLNISLQDCILNQVNSTPDAIAVSYYDEFISFKQLDEKSAKLASYLVNNGVKPDQLVGLCVERSIEMVVGLYAILKAGAAYLPIDPGYPKDRIEYMIEDANIAILLTQSSVKDELSLSMDGLLCLDSDWQTLIEPCEGITNQSVTADNLAYVIYTSGSTGKPKGVMIPHRCIVNHMRWMLSQFPLTTDDKILQKTPFSFDASVWEFFAPLMSGAELVMAKPNGHQDPNYLLDVIQQKQITTLQAVPSLLGMLISTTENDVAYSQHLSSLQRLFCGGEVLNIDLKQKVDSMSAELINLYGPTECTIDATYHVIEKELEIHRIPIGRAIANMQTYILDAKQNPVPLGVAGELYLAGSGVGRGYLYRKELTQDTFVELSLNDKSLWQAENLPTTLRLYKTGDKVRYLADGTIDYVERIDHQVKLRGYRIELGEIESALTRLDDITHSAVLVREDNPGIKRLVGYVVSSNKEAFDSTVVRQSLKSALPDYMVPTAYVILDEMPLSPSGKIDRKALPAPDGDSHGLESQFVEAGTDKEKRLAKIWQDVLKINRIGIHDNF
ncbi:MAG: amino acid adenylation domain-containing protein, partial [Methylococcales bacterium]|nr:amino acid adenylation domain-containing protein [Methylococcales bacterium]